MPSFWYCACARAGQRTGYDEQPQRDSRFDANSADVISIDAGRRADIAEGHGLAALKKADRRLGFSGRGGFRNDPVGLCRWRHQAALSYDLLQSFTQSIQQRASEGESLAISLDELRDVKIVNAKVFDSCLVTVEFQSTQTRMLTTATTTASRMRIPAPAS